MAGACSSWADDWQQQVDEVQALEAIFGDDFRILEASGTASSGAAAAVAAAAEDAAGSPRAQALDAAALAALDPPPCCCAEAGSGCSGCSSAGGSWQIDCSLLVRVEPPSSSLRLQLPEPGGGGLQREGSSSSGSSSREPEGIAADGGRAALPGGGARGSAAGYPVQFLPPVCMQLRLAAGYPSQHPPEVGLSALWLSSSQAARLEAQLSELWQEQGPGGPVCYTWADWLQSSALQHLGAADALLLEGQPSGEGTSEEGEGASSGGGGESGGEAAGGEAEGSAEDRLMKLLRCACRRGRGAGAAVPCCARVALFPALPPPGMPPAATPRRSAGCPPTISACCTPATLPTAGTTRCGSTRHLQRGCTPAASAWRSSAAPPLCA